MIWLKNLQNKIVCHDFTSALPRDPVTAEETDVITDIRQSRGHFSPTCDFDH
jgi:hypothetical protein